MLNNKNIKELEISCLQHNAIFEFCLECNKTTPFVKTLKCYYCGCDSPFGSYYDYNDISDEEIENYVNEKTVSFGHIKDIDNNVLYFLNNL